MASAKLITWMTMDVCPDLIWFSLWAYPIVPSTKDVNPQLWYNYCESKPTDGFKHHHSLGCPSAESMWFSSTVWTWKCTIGLFLSPSSKKIALTIYLSGALSHCQAIGCVSIYVPPKLHCVYCMVSWYVGRIFLPWALVGKPTQGRI